MNDLARQLAIAPRAGQPRREGDGRAAAPAGADAAPPRGDERTSTRSSSARASRAAPPRACTRSAGARVALVEQRPDLDAYKTVCTHYIQPSATPTIEKLGLAALIEEHGAVRNSIDLWTPYGGWIRPRGEDALRLQRHAPGRSIRSCAAWPPRRRASSCWRATRRPSCSATGGRRASSSRIASARAARCARAWSSPPTGATRTSRGWPACAGRVRPHNRFFYWAYWRGVRAGRRPLADVVHGARLRLHVPQRGRPVPRPRRRRTATACPSSAPTSRARTCATSPRCPTRPDLSRRHARVQAAGQARPAERQPPGRAARAWPSWATPRSPPTRCGASAAAGRSRARTGWCEETAERSSAAATSTRRSTPTARSTAAASGPHHFLISDLATARPANPLERAMYRSAVDRRRASTARSRRSGRAAARPRRCSRRGTLARLARPA